MSGAEMGNDEARGADHTGRTRSGGDRRVAVCVADVSVFMTRCTDCGRLGHDGPSWNRRTDAPSPLGPCRCGGEQTLERLDVNEALLRVP
jgi:hypothetical protein